MFASFLWPGSVIQLSMAKQLSRASFAHFLRPGSVVSLAHLSSPIVLGRENIVFGPNS